MRPPEVVLALVAIWFLVLFFGVTCAIDEEGRRIDALETQVAAK